MSSGQLSMGPLNFLETERIGTQKAGLLVGASQGRRDPERDEGAGGGDVPGLPAQPLHCLHFYRHISIFLLPPFPVCKKGIPLWGDEMRWRKSKRNLKVAELKNCK